MSAFRNADGRGILLSMVAAIRENRQFLSDVDGLIGDGDHGVNMSKGFRLYADALGDAEVSLSDGLFDLGGILLNKIGGSMGPIYGTIFMDMSDAADEADEIDLTRFAAMLEAGLQGLYGVVDARPGDKTLVDALHPAVLVLQADPGADFADALDAMKAAAEAGRDSTRDMVAQFGRAARLGERSRGALDAGAASCCVILCAMADGIKAALHD